MNRLKDYFDIAEQKKIIPNFWMNYPYLRACGVSVFSQGSYIWLDENGTCLFPPLSLESSDPSVSVFLPDYIWAGFPEYYPNGYEKGEFLDYNYVFRPGDFFHMEGGRWSTFRKNSKKWLKRNDNWHYSQHLYSGARESLEILLSEWLEEKAETVNDPEAVIALTLSNMEGVHRGYMYRNGMRDIVGVNIWNENYFYTNYTYCLCKPGEKFLDEAMRLLFYRLQPKERLINDGGVLDNPGLKRFKDKMNPGAKMKIYSYYKSPKIKTIKLGEPL